MLSDARSHTPYAAAPPRFPPGHHPHTRISSRCPTTSPGPEAIEGPSSLLACRLLCARTSAAEQHAPRETRRHEALADHLFYGCALFGRAVARVGLGPGLSPHPPKRARVRRVR